MRNVITDNPAKTHFMEGLKKIKYVIIDHI